MNKNYKIIFSKYSEEDLLEIVEYYNQINQAFSKSLFFEIEKKVNDLKDFSELGRIVPELEKQNIVEYRELIVGNYRIIYEIQEQSVTIHAIVDSRRNLEELIIRKLMRFY